MGPTKPRDRRLLPIILVVALLSCHGGFGAPHPSLPVPVTEHHAPVEQGAVPGHHSVGHPGGSDCAAPLAAVDVFGAALALLLIAVRAMRRSCAAPRAAWNLPATVAALPPMRGAPFLFLQVFRL